MGMCCSSGTSQRALRCSGMPWTIRSRSFTIPRVSYITPDQSSTKHRPTTLRHCVDWNDMGSSMALSGCLALATPRALSVALISVASAESTTKISQIPNGSYLRIIPDAKEFEPSLRVEDGVRTVGSSSSQRRHHSVPHGSI